MKTEKLTFFVKSKTIPTSMTGSGSDVTKTTVGTNQNKIEFQLTKERETFQKLRGPSVRQGRARNFTKNCKFLKIQNVSSYLHSGFGVHY